MIILSDREKRLLRRLADGKPDRKIASEIGGRRDQIAAQRERLLSRLGISSDPEIKEAARLLARWPYHQS
ncbi:LuxR C-terminal-related transcriptional regulator [Bradyrhizobium liaoningense]|uniref:LuxR C-terminal-related transcriptional regulator n=1 Tax=Bradyrhizobium liaoningense TaxID=43992 RepID=UPI001BA60DA5|nr:hypothetical protein [Bradyrhizobium liaoningense]